MSADRRETAPFRVAGLLLLAMSLSGCALFAAGSQVRGNRITEDQLKELVPGTSTKADATALLGSPTTHASFDDNEWLYIGQITRPRIGQTLGVVSQDVVALEFDAAGVLRGVTHKGEQDAQPVAMVSRTTPSPGTEANFFQQLFGNIGRFNPVGTGTQATGLPGL